MAANTKSLPATASGNEVVGRSWGASSNPTASWSSTVFIAVNRSASMSYNATSVTRGEP